MFSEIRRANHFCHGLKSPPPATIQITTSYRKNISAVDQERYAEFVGVNKMFLLQASDSFCPENSFGHTCPQKTAGQWQLSLNHPQI